MGAQDIWWNPPSQHSPLQFHQSLFLPTKLRGPFGYGTHRPRDQNPILQRKSQRYINNCQLKDYSDRHVLHFPTCSRTSVNGSLILSFCSFASFSSSSCSCLSAASPVFTQALGTLYLYGSCTVLGQATSGNILFLWLRCPGPSHLWVLSIFMGPKLL